MPHMLRGTTWADVKTGIRQWIRDLVTREGPSNR